MMEPWKRLDLLSRRGRRAIGLQCVRPPFQLTEEQEREMAELEDYWDEYESYEEDEA